jgi:7-cyano-7-deazaguanine synthase
LLSGGIDSTALAWWKRPIVAYTVDYGQASARGEIRAASAVCHAMRLRHEVITVDCSALGSGDLAGAEPLEIAPVPEWWPFRNQLLVTVAGMRAVASGIESVLVGSVASDCQHRDGTAEFFEQLNKLMVFQEGGVRVKAPAVAMNTVELVQQSGIPRSVLAWAHSCHTGEFACGACRGCGKHYSVIEELWGDGY